jgi:hypothetical protein
LHVAITDNSASGEKLREECLTTAFPQTRSEFPVFLNCLGLLGEAVEVGVQAGVHASSFLAGWRGRHLRLVDKWESSAVREGGDRSESQFYVDIANIQGAAIRSTHRTNCEARLASYLSAGRAELINMDSAVAASQIPDNTIDFVYLDARHDFMGIVADIHAWWPKVRIGGVFAGHDFVDGEFPEGDFFWITALREVLPGSEKHTRVTRETNMYPSFFIMKTNEANAMTMREVASDDFTRRLYAKRSRYFQLWRDGSSTGSGLSEFGSTCEDVCGRDCAERVRNFTPSRTAGSTLRPFACKESNHEHKGIDRGDLDASADVCGVDTVVDAAAYQDVCLERCGITCKQRGELFSSFGAEILAV